MPRKRQNPDNDRQRIQFAYNADLDSPIGILFQYLLKNERSRNREGKHKGVDAMTAFWKPFAYQEVGEVSEEDLQIIARESIEMLSRQMELICQTFGVERTEALATSNQLKQEIRQAVSEAIQELVVAERIPSSTQTSTLKDALSQGASLLQVEMTETEGVDFDEDALLGNLFDSADVAA